MSWAVDIRLIGALSVGLVGISSPASAADQALLLEVHVNGVGSGKIGEFILRDGVLMATRADLRDLGFRVAATGPANLVAVSALSPLTWRIDQPTQTLHVDGDADHLLPAVLGQKSNHDDGIAFESGTGAALDYDVSGNLSADSWSASGLVNVRLFSPRGAISSGMLMRVGSDARHHGGRAAIRLDSTLSHTDPESLRRYRAGDFITDGLASSRAVRMGGLQLTSNFSARPDMITFPLPALAGSAAVPSTLDVLVNGTSLLSADLAAGPFEVPQLPVVTGSGTIAMVLTDLSGRRVVTTIPVYVSRALLARGLQTYSFQLGALRRNWGLVSNDYGAFAATAAVRRGLSSRLTVEGTVEATRGNFMAGGGLALNIADLALLGLSAAASTGSGQLGSLLTAGIERIGRHFSLTASVASASRGYLDVAATSGERVPRLRTTASASLSLGSIGSLNLAYLGMTHRSQTPGRGRFERLVHVAAARTHIVSGTYSAQFGSLAIHASGFRDFGDGRSIGLNAGISLPMGRSGSAGMNIAAGTGGRGVQVNASRPIIRDGDWGYHAFASAGKTRHAFAFAQHQTPWAVLGAGIARSGSTMTARAEVQGSLAVLGGKVWTANALRDSFAVVDTNGIANVRVLRENQVVGRTDKTGRLLIKNLSSFEVNHLAIDPDDVSADTTIPFATRAVRPMERSGVLVSFSLRPGHAALLKLVDAAGQPVALGSTVTLQSSGATVPVGHDGEAFVEDLADDNSILVARLDGSQCGARFAYRPAAGEIPVIGPVQCEERP